MESLTLALDVCLIFSAAMLSKARAVEFQASIYGGDALTMDNHVAVDRPGGMDLHFKDVAFKSSSLTSPIDYGARLAWWEGQSSAWGILLDFTQRRDHGRSGSDRGRLRQGRWRRRR